ncbi:MerR family transcriptional regulator [Amycolatopsis sp. Hca4]|nr:MerR family transcriptional regulator [Amycolatopsis sp. Hca4]
MTAGEGRALGSGEVARTLGVSQVTLRTWEHRYGIGARARDRNGRRRYTADDVERLRRMRALQAQGVGARDAASLVLSRWAAGMTAARRRECLAAAADALDLSTVGGVVDDAFGSLGVAKAWTDVLAPVLRAAGLRWAKNGDRTAMAAEWALATAASGAVDRYPAPAPTRTGRPPVVLLSTPVERHELPIKVLGAALRDDGVPAVHLGGLVSVDVLRVVAARLQPRSVVVWSMTAHSADVRILQVLHAEGMPVRPAGPGWRGLPVVGEPLPSSLSEAMVELSR